MSDVDSLMMQKLDDASLESTPPQRLAVLASDSNSRIRWAVARNASTPSYALTSLTKDSVMEVVIAAVRNPHTNPSDLDAVTSNPDPHIRAQLVSNPSISITTFKRLLLDPAERVRSQVALLTSLPTALAHLSGDPSPLVRRAVAANEHTDVDTLTGLLDSRELSVLRSLADNPNLSINSAFPASFFYILSRSESAPETFLNEALSSLPLTQRQYVEALLPEWEGSLRSLINAARLLL